MHALDIVNVLRFRSKEGREHLFSDELSTGKVTTKAVLSAEKFRKSGPLGKPPRMMCGSMGASKLERHCVCQCEKQKSGDSFVP